MTFDWAISMPLLFKYKQVRIRRPAIALGGRLTRPRSLIHATLLGASSVYLAEVLLDPGADDTIFPNDAAVQLGLDLSNAPLGEATGVAGTAMPVRFAQVILRLTDGHEYCEWPALVGFTAAPLRHPLLGFAGCLQFFDSDFRGEREEVELATNNLYPGHTGLLVP
jgi:hypothetical protein